MQPILSVTVPVKKIKGTARQCYGGSDGDGVVWCGWTFIILMILSYWRHDTRDQILSHTGQEFQVVKPWNLNRRTRVAC